MSKPSSQPASHRSGRSIGAALDGAQDPAALQSDDPSRDGARSEASGGAGDLGDADELLTRSLLKRGLVDLAPTADRAGFAFQRLELQGQGIKTLEGDLASYPELRYVNLGNNEISDLGGLAVLPRLLALQLAYNHLDSLDSLVANAHTQLQLLQADHCEIQYILSKAGGGMDPVGAASAAAAAAAAAVSGQKIKKLAPTGPRKPLSALSLNLPALFALTLSNNKISSLVRPEDAGSAEMQRDAHPSLQVLDLAFNQLASLDGIACFPQLRVLNLQSNLLESLAGVQNLLQLEKLNVSDNKLASLSGGDLARLKALPKLTHLVIMAGNVGLMEEMERNLAAAVEAGTALESQQANGVDMVSEILTQLPRLLFLDGKRVTAAMRKTADLLQKERAADAERRAEEEALAKKLAAEEEAAEKKAREEEEDEENKDKDSDDEEEDDAEKSMDSAGGDAEAADDGAAGGGADDEPQGGDDNGADQSFDDQAGGDDEPQGGDDNGADQSFDDQAGGGDEPPADEDDGGGEEEPEEEEEEA